MTEGLHPCRIVDALGLVIQDETAERCLAGCAIYSGHEARLILSQLQATAFYDPTLWAVVVDAAALSLAIVDRAEQWQKALKTNSYALVAHSCLARVDALVWKGYDRSWLTALVTDRPVVADSAGVYVRRLQDAARARAERGRHLDALKASGLDVVALLTSYGDLLNRLDVLQAQGACVVWPEGQAADVPKQEGWAA